MSDHTKMKPPSLWIPTTNTVVQLAVLGKLGEEVTEAGTALFRCSIQGIDGNDPETGKPNRQWLAEELADIQALRTLAIRELGLDMMKEREARKYAHKAEWLRKLRAAAQDKTLDICPACFSAHRLLPPSYLLGPGEPPCTHRWHTEKA